MFVRCISNQLTEISPFARQGLRECPVEPGRGYTVYGMSLDSSSGIDYFVSEEFPYCIPAELCEVVDGRIPRCWIYNQNIIKMRVPSPHLLLAANWGYPEYASVPDHYPGVVDGHPQHIAIFRRWKEIMDMEYPNPDVALTAGPLEGNWLQCPACLDAWESTSRDGMVRCPACKAVQRNPRYVNWAQRLPAIKSGGD